MKSSSKPVPPPPSINAPVPSKPGIKGHISTGAAKRHSANISKHYKITSSSKTQLCSSLENQRYYFVLLWLCCSCFFHLYTLVSMLSFLILLFIFHSRKSSILNTGSSVNLLLKKKVQLNEKSCIMSTQQNPSISLKSPVSSRYTFPSHLITEFFLFTFFF